MKRKYSYSVNGKRVEREYNYIPVRYIIAVALAALSVAGVIATLVVLCRFVPYFYLAAYATWIFVIIKITASDDNPDYKAPWLLVVMLIPVAGFMLYFMFYSRKLKSKYVKRLSELRTRGYDGEDSALTEALRESDPHACSQAKMLCRLSGGRLFSNTEVTYFPLGEHMLPELLSDLEAAERFIYMEYFIIEEGKFWDPVLEVLKRKAAAGVEVKLLYDDLGCMSALPADYDKQLRRFGIEAAQFSRLRGNADSEFNNRSHRKITVIDGRIGYTGGINIADEYINERSRFGHWKDTGIRLFGEGVWELTALFVADYGISVKTPPTFSDGLYPEQPDLRAEGMLIPFGDGPSPIYERRVGKSVIMNMLAHATEYACITTPYLIPDSETCAALESAAERGVRVQIITPGVPDKRMVYEMTRSFYPRLMKAGVEIYEYTPGFVHAKSYLVDGKYAMIGTINLDYRSLVHNFENGVWLYNCPVIGEMKKDFDDTLSACRRVTDGDLKVGAFRRMLRAVLRIFAPIM